MTNPYRFIADNLTGGTEIPFQPIPLQRVEITPENRGKILNLSPEELDERVGILLALGKGSASILLPEYLTLRALLVQKQSGGAK